MMRKLLKKVFAATLTATLVFGMTACSQDNSWAMKSGEETVPIGAYICNLIMSRQSALQKADSSKDLFEQQIDGKDANTWIKEDAMTNTKAIVFLDNKMKELNLSISEEEQTQIESVTNSNWTQLETLFEQHGVSKDSYKLAYTEQSVKMNKVFNAIYGKDGTQAVSDDEIKDFFHQHYTNFEYIIVPLFDVEQSSAGAETALSDDEIAAAKKEFDDYAAKINSGAMTMAEAVEAFKNSDFTVTDDPLQNVITDLEESSGSYPAEFVEMLNGMKADEAKTIQLTMSSGDVYALAVKRDIAKASDEYLGNESNRSSVLASMKYEEFSNMLKEETAKLEVTLNDSAIKKYEPSSMFKSSK